MFEEMQKALQKPTQDMKDMRTEARIDKFGSIHFKLIQDLAFGKAYEKTIELQWNLFLGKEITNERVKEELEKLRKVLNRK